jgi:hypothetical protein
MIDYLTSLLPRLQQFSKSLNDTAIFADVPWAFIDGDGERVTYIFRRNNELLVSKHGEVTTGHWEYLAAMQSLLIEHANRKRMYNQGFVDNVVMALRKDGTNELFLLANQQALPDLDAVKYLEKKAEVKIEPFSSGLNESSIVALILTKPKREAFMEINNGVFAIRVGNKVFTNKTGDTLPDGKYHSLSGYIFEVNHGKISKLIKADTLTKDFIIEVIVVVLLFISFLLVRNSR